MVTPRLSADVGRTSACRRRGSTIGLRFHEMSRLPEGKGRVGLIPLGLGLILAGIGVLDPRDHAFPSGRPPVFAASPAFIFAGAAMLINGMTTPYRTGLLAINGSFLICSRGRPAGNRLVGRCAVATPPGNRGVPGFRGAGNSIRRARTPACMARAVRPLNNRMKRPASRRRAPRRGVAGV